MRELNIDQLLTTLEEKTEFCAITYSAGQNSYDDDRCKIEFITDNNCIVVNSSKHINKIEFSCLNKVFNLSDYQVEQLHELAYKMIKSCIPGNTLHQFDDEEIRIAQNALDEVVEGIE